VRLLEAMVAPAPLNALQVRPGGALLEIREAPGL